MAHDHVAALAGEEGAAASPRVPRVMTTRVVPVALAHSAARQLPPGPDTLAECNDSLAEHGITCGKMGRVYEKMGRLDEAMDMLLQHLVIAQRCVGPARVPGRAPPAPALARARAACAHAAHAPAAHAPAARVLRGCAGWEMWRAYARRAGPSGLCTRRWETTRPPWSR